MLVVLKQQRLSYDASRLFASALFGKRFALDYARARAQERGTPPRWGKAAALP